MRVTLLASVARWAWLLAVLVLWGLMLAWLFRQFAVE